MDVDREIKNLKFRVADLEDNLERMSCDLKELQREVERKASELEQITYQLR